MTDESFSVAEENDLFVVVSDEKGSLFATQRFEEAGDIALGLQKGEIPNNLLNVLIESLRESEVAERLAGDLAESVKNEGAKGGLNVYPTDEEFLEDLLYVALREGLGVVSIHYSLEDGEDGLEMDLDGDKMTLKDGVN